MTVSRDPERSRVGWILGGVAAITGVAIVWHSLAKKPSPPPAASAPGDAEDEYVRTSDLPEWREGFVVGEKDRAAGAWKDHPPNPYELAPGREGEIKRVAWANGYSSGYGYYTASVLKKM